MRLYATTLFVISPILALSADVHGRWTMAPSNTPEKASFSITYSSGEGHHSQSSSEWPLSDFPGLDFSNQNRHDVRFKIDRDAGVIDCDGFLQAGEGAGLFHFSPRPQYARDMEALGFAGFSGDKLFAAAEQNVSLQFARNMKAAGLAGLDADKLIAFRIFNVTPEFVRELRGAGIEAAESDKLIAFRIHGVSPEFARSIQKLGFERPSPDKLIALRIHGVTTAYIEKLRFEGIRNLTLDQVLALRIQGID